MTRLVKRPLWNRSIKGPYLSEDAVLVRVVQHRNNRGITIRSETRTNIRLATTPVSDKHPRYAELIEGGARLEDIREFYTVESINVKAGDKIVYPAVDGDIYTIRTSARFIGHSESIGYRNESQ